MRTFLIILYVLLGLVQVAVRFLAALFVGEDFMAGDPEATSRDVAAAFLLLGYLAMIPTVWIFLDTVYRGKKFLFEQGQLLVSTFWVALAWFIVPFAGLVVPWSRFARYRNTLSHYLQSGQLEITDQGRGATVWLAIIFNVASFFDNILTRSDGIEPDAFALVAILSGALWFVSLLYSTIWLVTYWQKVVAARQRFAEMGSAEVFA